VESLSNGTFPSKDYCMIWITCDTAREEVHAILDSFLSWAANIKTTGTRIVIFGRQGPQYKRPAVQALVDNRVLHISKHRACHKPLVLPETGAKHSQVAFTVPTSTHTQPAMPMQHQAGGSRQRLDQQTGVPMWP